MPTSQRYTVEMIRAYVDGGHWRPELTVDFWDRNARERPHALALADGTARYSWAEAAEAVDRLAAGLQGAGHRGGETLLVQAPNSCALLLLRLAAEKAGIILAFLHFGFRRNEIAGIAALTEPSGAIFPAATEKLDLGRLYGEAQRSFPSLRRRYYIDAAEEGEIGSIPALLNGGRAAAPASARRFSPFEVTGIVTSSGTTGLPKCIEYAPWPRLASGRVYIRRLAMTADDVVLACIPLYTGGADLLFHTAPQIGATQILLEAFSPAAFCAAVEKYRATGAIVVPTMLSRLLDFPERARYDLTSLRFITCGGGMLPRETGRRAEEALGAKIIQGYGLMDYGALASHAIDDPQEVRLSSNGKVLDGTELMILGEDGKPVLAGATGHVCARGPHCNGGYLKNAAATAEAWRDGYFRTGDLGRLDAAGYLVLEGRSKDIIIRGGQNISAPEVEAILCRHPQIIDAALVRMPDPDMGERACAFIVPTRGAAITLAEIGRFMGELGVAAFKIPERVEMLPALPMVPAGNKVDKRRLEERVRQSRES